MPELQGESVATPRPLPTIMQAPAKSLTPLQHAVITTIAYRDLFDYPVTAAEIHRYLHGVACTLPEVEAVLVDREFVDNYLCSDGHYYALQDRHALFDVRRRREAKSATFWPGAVAQANRLASMPFVRMVAVTGSLATNNADNGADFDFMLITDGGRMWTCRLASKALQFADRLFAEGRMCVNYLRSTRALQLDERSLYIAQELAQMVPLYGQSVYAQLREANRWVDEWLPNAHGGPDAVASAKPAWPRAKRAVEAVLAGRPGRALERWECRRKLHRYNDTEFLLGRSTPFSAEATGHRHNVRRLIEDAFADRVDAVGQTGERLRVLVAQAYHLYLDPKLYNSMQPFPPLGSLYAAAVVRQLGHTVRVHDSMLAASLHEWRSALQVNRPGVVVLFEDNFNYLTKMCLSNMRDAAVTMIEAAQRIGARVIVCGSDSSDEPEFYLRAGAEIVMIGEGEQTLQQVFEVLAGTRRREDTAGIAFLDEQAELCRTAPRAVIRQIDEIPLPAWDLIDLERYAEIWQRRYGRVALNVVTTRGCPYHCNWCAKPIWGQRYNARSPENVVDEIVQLRQRVELDYLWFMDDIFGLKPRWIARFADALQRRDLRIRFKALSRPDILLRPGEVEALARAGCDVIWMGAESGSQKILDAMEKGTTVQNIFDACGALQANGIRVGLFIQFGYPGERLEDVRATLRMIRQILPDELGVSVSYPLPGTRFYDRVKAELGETRHWTDSDDLAMLFNGPFNSRFYRALHRYVHLDLAWRRAWRELAAPARRRGLSLRRQLRKAALIPYAALRSAYYAVAMQIWSRLPHAGIRPLPVELSPVAAARPSAQPPEEG